MLMVVAVVVEAVTTGVGAAVTVVATGAVIAGAGDGAGRGVDATGVVSRGPTFGGVLYEAAVASLISRSTSARPRWNSPIAFPRARKSSGSF